MESWIRNLVSFLGGFRWNGFRLRRHGFQIGRSFNIDVACRPGDGSNQDALERWIRPDVLPMSHGGIEHSSLSMVAGPGGWVIGALIIGTLHPLGILHQDHVQVRRKVLQGIPFIFKAETFLNLLTAGEVSRG